MSRDDPDFLSRWSRRKLLHEDADAGAEPPEAPAQAAAEAEPDPEKDAALLAELGLRAPEDLEPGEELAAFLKAAIPAHLKRRALRVLWRSNPVLANLDGLNDYDGDFTGNVVPRGQLKTAFRVGRGFADSVREAPAAASDPAPVEPTDDLEKVQGAAEISASAPDGAGDEEALSNEESRALDRPEIRRMSFRFDSDA